MNNAVIIEAEAAVASIRTRVGQIHKARQNFNANSMDQIWQAADQLLNTARALQMTIDRANAVPSTLRTEDEALDAADLRILKMTHDELEAEYLGIGRTFSGEVAKASAAIDRGKATAARMLLKHIPTSELLDLLLMRIDFDGMDPNTFTIFELRRAI